MPTTTPTLEHHLRVELVDDAHRDWPAIRRRVAGSVAHRADGRLSARQAVVAAFVQGRAVAHAAFHVEPAAGEAVVARLDSHHVDTPFAGTAVEHVLMTVAHARVRTMGCRDLVPARRAA